ncbi:hypothetical protein [Streptomyces benahoarensis]|uniref:Uncharacterized protein n=1 Tax=Streptomyces benahoarensis TaxID=2595054 RepID=A0A553ZQC8_9ACTN|nr:hypothetical protein [Streptomyces benahoarensis]TSB32086.1 hypothetical protein FNJ62_03415 [Streptomyces benahoarensis]TSB43623.1 hypothetical protein FNZ23_03465 [Streptomyces benahoarensis]
MTVAVQSMVPEYVWTANNALVFTPTGMPLAAYPLIPKLLGNQEPGGRVVAVQDVIASWVGMSRSQVTRGLQHLGFAQMVWKEGNGVYRLSPLIAGFRTPAEQLAAIGEMDDDDRFDHPHFQERYEHRVAEYEKERLEKAVRRQRPTEPIDLASRRKR